MRRNPNPARIQDNNDSPSTPRNSSLTMIYNVARNPNPKRIQDVISNPYPTRIEDPLTYNGSPITWACAKKMKEALHVLIQTIWAQSINLNNCDPYGAHGVHSDIKLIQLVQIEDLGPSNVLGPIWKH